MTTDYSQNYSKNGALAAYNDGVPSTLPEGNKWKPFVEGHRWGRHRGDGYSNACPVCETEKNAR